MKDGATIFDGRTLFQQIRNLTYRVFFIIDTLNFELSHSIESSLTKLSRDVLFEYHRAVVLFC